MTTDLGRAIEVGLCVKTERASKMNDHEDGSAGPGTRDLGWLVRCKNGCDGIVHSSVPRIGDPCPLCTSDPAKKSIITYCVKIAAAGETHEQILMEGGISFDGDVVQSWDVDLGTFVTSADSEDGDAAAVLESDISLENNSLRAEGDDEKKLHAKELNDIQEGTVTTIQEIVGGLVQETSLTAESPQQDLESTDFTESPRVNGGMRFNKWHVFGLICCAALLLAGALLTFDIVRAIYSPRDIRTASPILKVLR